MTLLLALLAGCAVLPAPTPEVTSVAPDVAMPGDTLRVAGAAFDDEVMGVLVQGAVSVPLPLDVLAAGEASATVPDDLPSGVWALHVETPSGRHGAPVMLEVWRPETEPPCDKRYALATETSRTQKKVAVERIFRDRPSTRDLFFAADMARLAHTRTPTAAGATCSALWLIDAEGRRWLLADDPERDLEPMGRELASVLGLELQR